MEMPEAVQTMLTRSEDSDPLRDVDINAMSVMTNHASDLGESGTNITDALSMTGEVVRSPGWSDGYLMVSDDADLYSPSSVVCRIPSTDLDGKYGSELKVNTGEHTVALKKFRLASQPSQPKFFWEQNNWLGHVFGGKDSVVDNLFREQAKFSRVDAPLVVVPVVDSIDSTDVTGTKRKLGSDERAKPFFLDATSKTTVEEAQETRIGFCTEWVNIVLINWEAFDFTVMLMSNNKKISREELLESMLAAMAPKATSTIAKRLSSMSRFVLWCVKNGRGLFPLEEPSLFDYLKSLKSAAKPSPSAGKSFLEALRFAGGVLGLKSDEFALRSTRVSGLAEELARAAPVVAQANPLTVMQVCKLERLIMSTPSTCDRVLLGGILALLYSCGRASDGARAVRVIVDEVDADLRGEIEGPPGFIELRILASKGAKALKLRRQLLPLIIPMMSASGVAWWQYWASSRQALDMGFEGELRYPLIPCFTADGQPTLRSMGASEIGKLLRSFLGEAHLQRNVIRSHSMKATILSWMAKFGSPLPLRRLAGHHLDSTSKSPETYSRDAMAPVMTEVCKILEQIAKQQFLPDATRSGRFMKQKSGVQPEVIDPSPVQVDGCDDTDSDVTEPSSDESSDAGGPMEECDEIPDSTPLLHFVPSELRPYLVVVDASMTPWRNKASHVVHLAKEDAEKLLCGRLIGSSYVKLCSVNEDACRCKVCFSNQNAGRVHLRHGGNVHQ